MVSIGRSFIMHQVLVRQDTLDGGVRAWIEGVLASAWAPNPAASLASVPCQIRNLGFDLEMIWVEAAWFMTEMAYLELSSRQVGQSKLFSTLGVDEGELMGIEFRP